MRYRPMSGGLSYRAEPSRAEPSRADPLPSLSWGSEGEGLREYEAGQISGLGNGAAEPSVAVKCIVLTLMYKPGPYR
jgi:hypothetical protein